MSGNGYVLPTGNIASAVFIYRNMVDGLPWAQIWYYQGREIARTETVWSDGANGAKTISIQETSGLLPGDYRLELYIEGRLSATSDFTIAGAQEGAVPVVFTDARFASAANPQEAVGAPPSSSFSTGTERLYALFNWQGIAPGTLWTVRWLVDDGVFFEQSQPWSLSTSGRNYVLSVQNPAGLPDGTYTLELQVGAVRLARTQARIGIGQLPIDPFAQSDEIQLRGQILDAATSVGIPGVSFILISQDYSVADFLASRQMEQVYAFAITDRNGRFEVNRPLSFKVPYSVVILAAGYLPIQADGVLIDPDDENLVLPIEMTIYLSRG